MTPPPESRARVFQVVNRYRGSAGRSPLNSCEPFVPPGGTGADRRMGPGPALPITDPTLPISRVLRRLTRKIAGVTVGIALGVGRPSALPTWVCCRPWRMPASPVDLVAGTSMGSIVALGYAVGMTPPEMYEVAGRIGNVRTALSALDPSLSGAGLLNGRRLVSIFSPILQRESFEDLDVPCRVVALDIEAGTPVSIGSGSLDEAFRTSCSIPIIFKPVRRGSQTLVDGGMIDPVPSGVVREMGADIVIAVNVVPRLEPGVSTSLSRTFKRVNYLNPISYLSGSRDLPDILDIFMT